MKWTCLLLLLAAAWPPRAAAQAQQPVDLVVEAGHSLVIARPGVTAAYSLDPGTVEADAIPGGFRITGKMPGQTTVILVTIAGTRNVGVTVPEPPHANFPGMAGMGGAGQTIEFGHYEVRYNSGPTQISNIEDVTQIAGERQIHVQIMNTDIFPASGEAPVGFPLLSYQISHPGRSLTLVDQMVDNTELTMKGILLRGVHLQTGSWEFHAGITSVTEFQDFLLPSNRYEVASLSRHFHLNRNSALEANLLYFATNTSVNTGATPGPLATLFYRYHRLHGLDATAEIGVGNGFAVSTQVGDETKTESVNGSFHYQSAGIASISLGALHGRTADFSWQGRLSHRLQVNAMGTDTDVNLATEKQLVDTVTVNQVYKITSHLGITSGLLASRFISILPSAPAIRSAGYLAGPQLQWNRFGGSFLFEQENNSGHNPDSTSYQFNAQTSLSHLNVSAYYDTQTETPVLAPVQSSTQPDLRQTLNYESEVALNPLQMSQFLRQTNGLSAQGFIQPVTVGLASRRDQYGLNLQWAQNRTGQINFNGLVNTSEGGSVPSLRLVSGGIVWTRKIGNVNVLNAGFSLYSSATGGQRTLQPLEQFSWQHQLNSVPRWLVPGRRGSISGHVFVDNTYMQAYRTGDTPIPGVLIYLDGRRTTHTDSRGYYVFRGVPYGVHSVQADYRDSRAFYLTSGSPKSVPMGATADFGISFAKGRIFGSFTDGDGHVEIEGLPYGTYTVIPDPSSLPPGYSLSDLTDQTIVLTAKQAAHFTFRIKAQRSISGHVQLFDPSTGKAQPLADAIVSLGSGQLVAHTDSEGRYLFRQLPAGSYKVSVVHDGKIWSRPVELDPTPDTATDVDIMITQPSSSPVSEPAAPLEPPPPLHRQRRREPRHRRLQSGKRETAPPPAVPGSAGNDRP
jgi:hypothetical protein